MCCFSRPVKYVASTSIFARVAAPGRQILVYSMTVGASEDTAMILPLPVPPGSPDGAVRFIDLSGYARLFDDLADAFPQELLYAKSRGLFAPQSISRSAPLVVHDVGDFEASFVPTLGDFDRLDPRFRLDNSVWKSLPQYADHGFAVFKLRGFASGWLGRMLRRTARKSFHPMAFEFPTREPSHLFYPTVHIHDGVVHPTAQFDHTLYAQASSAPRACVNAPREPADESGWLQGSEASRSVRIADTQGVVTTDGLLFRWSLGGLGPNCDRWAPLGG